MKTFHFDLRKIELQIELVLDLPVAEGKVEHCLAMLEVANDEVELEHVLFGQLC